MKIINLFYPPLCLHCEEEVNEGQHLFCRGCIGFFELIDPGSRCPYCFSENEKKKPCQICISRKRGGVKIASALDYLGAVSTLVKQMKYGRLPYLAKTGAAFMLTQYHRLEWQAPDLIIPVPRRHWFQGDNHASLLAEQLAKGLGAQCAPILKRHAGDLSQARLSKTQRESLAPISFYLNKPEVIEDKIILLVDDVVTTGTTLHRCAEVLSQAFPTKIYALSLARAI